MNKSIERIYLSALKHNRKIRCETYEKRVGRHLIRGYKIYECWTEDHELKRLIRNTYWHPSVKAVDKLIATLVSDVVVEE